MPHSTEELDQFKIISSSEHLDIPSAPLIDKAENPPANTYYIQQFWPEPKTLQPNPVVVQTPEMIQQSQFLIHGDQSNQADNQINLGMNHSSENMNNNCDQIMNQQIMNDRLQLLQSMFPQQKPQLQQQPQSMSPQQNPQLQHYFLQPNQDLLFNGPFGSLIQNNQHCGQQQQLRNYLPEPVQDTLLKSSSRLPIQNNQHRGQQQKLLHNNGPSKFERNRGHGDQICKASKPSVNRLPFSSPKKTTIPIHCKFYARGCCKYSSNCRYLHVKK